MTLESNLRQHIIETTAGGRGRPASEVSRWYKQTIFTGKAALDEGLVDVLGYRDEAKSAFFTAIGKNFDRIDWDDFSHEAKRKEREKGLLLNKDGIALIEFAGEIVDSGDEDTITPKNVRKRTQWAEKEDRVKAVVIRISSPGGSMAAADLMWADIAKLAKKKPVIVSMGNYAASGGYYIATPAKRIFADAATITGSIGVYGMFPNAQHVKEKWGVSFHMITGSDRRALLNLGQQSSSFDMTLIETMINDAYDTFLGKVAAGRGFSVEKAHSLGQGRVYTGLEAHKNGLVDEIGGLQKAINYAAKEAGISNEALPVIYRYKGGRFSIKACLVDPEGCIQQLEAGAKLVKNRLFRPKTLDSKINHLIQSQMRKTITQKTSVMAMWPGYYSQKFSSAKY
jgi:protease-4